MAPARLLREASADALVVELAPQQDAVASSERSALQALRALQTAVARPVAAPLAVPTSARPAEVEGEGEGALQVGQPWATLSQEARMAPARDFRQWPERQPEMPADAAGKPASAALKAQRTAPLQNSVELETRLTVVAVELAQPAAVAPREAPPEPRLVAALGLGAQPPEME